MIKIYAMKTTITVILLFFSLKNYSQWTYNTGKSDFDGEYKTSSVYGNGGSFPYNRPVLVVNKFKNSAINIYLTAVGYSGCQGKIVYFKFNGDDEIYKTTFVGEGINNKSWHIESLKNIDKIELLKKLKEHSSVSVRIRSNCGSSDYSFSLKGSTKALNFVLGKDFIEDYIKEKQNEKIRITYKRQIENIKLAKDKERNEKKVDNLTRMFTEKVNKQKNISLENLSNLKNQIKDFYKIYNLDDNQYFINKTDIMAYKNIYEIEYEFIIPRKTFLVIEKNYLHKDYHKLMYIGEKYYGKLVDKNIYIKKINFIKL